MANVAGTLATGPASKDTVSGGKKFPLKERQAGIGGRKKMNNQSGEAQRAIMGLKYNNGGKFPKTTEQAFTGKKAPR